MQIYNPEGTMPDTIVFIVIGVYAVTSAGLIAWLKDDGWKISSTVVWVGVLIYIIPALLIHDLALEYLSHASRKPVE